MRALDPRHVAPMPDGLLAAERDLHHPLGTRAEFEAGVLPGYREVGASGGVYDVDVIWDVTTRRRAGAAPTPRWTTSEEAASDLGGDTWLLTYLLDQGGRLSRRVTLWRREAGRWVALYHQGTVVTGEY